MKKCLRRSRFVSLSASLAAGSLMTALAFTGCTPGETTTTGTGGGSGSGGNTGSGTGGDTGSGTGGSTGSGGQLGTGTGGGTGSGGSGSGGSASGGSTGSGGDGSGGSGSGGMTGSGGDGSGGSAGMSGSGGSSMGGQGGSTGGRGGSGSGGRGGTTGGSGGAGGMSGGSGGSSGGAAQPSAGCGKASPQTGSSGSPLTISGHQYYVKLPANYNASNPYKVMIMFPPTNNPITWSEQSAGYEQAAPDAIRVYTLEANVSSGWQPNETSFFKPFYDDITGRYCIDKSRVFAAGESSGGEFAAFVGCEYGDLVRGVAPGAPKMTSWKIDPAAHTCKGNPTAIVIWSEKDNVLTQPAGPAFRDFYRTRNMCQTTSTAVQGYTDALSNCKMFDGCQAGSDTYYCMHMDPNYSNTYHGWAGFAAKMTWGVFSKL